MSNEKGREVLGGLMSQMPAGGSHAGFEMTEEMAQMTNGFTVIRMINLVGTMMNLDLPKEKLLELNAILNQIPKGNN